MDTVRRLHLDPVPPVDISPKSLAAPITARNPLTGVLRSLGASLDDQALSGPPPATAQDWSGLIDRVRAAASHAREVEAQANEQEQNVQDLLERVREDIRVAGERVRAAETRASLAEARAETRVRAAEQRAEAAEERARVGEEWLQRVYDTVASEFAAIPSSKSGS